METYRLKSRLVEHEKEFVIQTLNDATLGAISSEVYIDGTLAESVSHPHPMDIRAEEVLSLLKEKHGQKKREIETLLTAHKKIMADGDREMMQHLGTALYYKGFFTEARDVFQALITIDPDNQQARNLLAMALLALDDVDGAVNVGAESVAARPGYADFHNNYGEALLSAGEFEKAHKQFKEAIEINLYYGDAYFNLGLTYIGLATASEFVKKSEKLLEKATDCFKRAAMINTGYDTGYFDEGIKALREGDINRAWTALHAVRRSWKIRHRREFAGFHMRFVLHPEWVSEHALNDRIRYLEREVQKNPGYVDLYTELGRSYFEQARLVWQKGIQQYRKARELNPSLGRIAERQEIAEKQYSDMNSTLEKMGQKG